MDLLARILSSALVFFIGYTLLELGLPLALVLSILTFLLLTGLSVMVRPQRQVARPIPPQPPEPEEPEEEEEEPQRPAHVGNLLVLENLTLLIRSKKNLRLGLTVRPTDIGIRPYAEFNLWERTIVGKQATLRFKLINPRRRTRHDWQVDVDFIFRLGRNIVWPQSQEFPIQKDLYRGEWSMSLELRGAGGYSLQWREVNFRLIEDVDVNAMLGPDGSLTSSQRKQIADSIGPTTVEDLLNSP